MTSAFGTLTSVSKDQINGESLDASSGTMNLSHYMSNRAQVSIERSQAEYALSYGDDISGNLNHWLASDGMTTYQVPFTTSTIPIRSRFNENERKFRVHVLMGQVFGAFYQMCVKRKTEDGLNKATLGERMGKDKSRLTQMLSGPGNWSLKTIAEFANALEMDFHFFLSDRKLSGRISRSTGIEYVGPNYFEISAVSNGNSNGRPQEEAARNAAQFLN